MIRNFVNRFVQEEDGMEMLEWAFVAIFFAVAGSAIWGQVAGALNGALQNNVIATLTGS